MSSRIGKVIGIDWGTTNRRIYLIDADGHVEATIRDDRGVLAMAGCDYNDELSSVRHRFGDLPIMCAGMVGSDRGWVTVPYRPCPADLAALVGALHWIEPGRLAIVPGLSQIMGPKGDVMRGEEIQLLGAVAAGLAPPDGLLCQPGTHCKWARLAGGAVTDFRTSITGELFALLQRHSLLADILDGAVTDGSAFREGLMAAKQTRLLGDLFGARAATLLGLRRREDAASYVSGLLIGGDVREQALGARDIVYLIANTALSALYGGAIETTGATVVTIDSDQAFPAGITALWRLANAS